jgi:hypothetical protein
MFFKQAKKNPILLQCNNSRVSALSGMQHSKGHKFPPNTTMRAPPFKYLQILYESFKVVCTINSEQDRKQIVGSKYKLSRKIGSGSFGELDESLL